MSLFCSPFPLSATLFSTVAVRQAVPFLRQIEVKGVHTRLGHSKRLRRPLPEVSITTGLEAWLVRALVKAGRCHEHQTKIRNTPSFFSAPRPKISIRNPKPYCRTFRKYQHTKAVELDWEEQEQLPAISNRTREKLLELVDQYDGTSYTDQPPSLELSNRYQPSDGPHLTVSDSPEDEWPPPHYAWPANSDTRIKLEHLDAALRGEAPDPQVIYRLYKALPGPRVPYLESKTRHRMLHHLAVVERKDEHSMLRYLSVVDDMKASAIPLSISEWNSALSFISRYVDNSTAVEVEAALQMWREMEHIAGVQGNHVTFNIIFDVACKAGKFTLAEMIYEEMKSRGLEFDRYHHVSMIFYHGLLRDGDGARAAYKELVEAGEMVDTTVLNAMISALIRAREANAAQNIYERMKQSYLLDTHPRRLAPRDFRTKRKLTRILKTMARVSKLHKEKRGEFQRQAIMAPDMKTFQLLINYYTVVAGDLDKSTQLLDEMRSFELPLHGALFLSLLKGFARHGGVRYTSWTEPRLQSVWKSLLKALDRDVEGLYISKGLVVWGLRAFAKCSGKAGALAAWEEIKMKWCPEENELKFVMNNLRTLLEDKDMANQRYDWLLGSL